MYNLNQSPIIRKYRICSECGIDIDADATWYHTLDGTGSYYLCDPCFNGTDSDHTTDEMVAYSNNIIE